MRSLIILSIALFSFTAPAVELELEIDGETVAKMVASAFDARLDCDGSLDAESRAVFARLDAKRRSTWRGTEGDGELLLKRRGQRLIVELRGDGGGFKATVPWAVGECLLGRSIDLAEVLEDGEFKLELYGGDGRIDFKLGD